MSQTQSSVSTSQPGDVVRQGAVLLGGVVAVLGLLAGLGVFGGTPIGQVDGLSASGSLVAPAGVAFSIWSVIYAGLAGLAVWQALPSRREDQRLRRAGWPVAVSMVANAAWILAAQAGFLVLSVVLIATILASLVVAMVRLLPTPPGSLVEAVLLDGTVGLYAGWVSIATVANVAGTLVAGGYGDLVPGRTFWGVTLLLVAGAVGSFVAWTTGGRVAYPLALVWALCWVVAARLTGPTESTVAAVAAGVSAATVAVVTVVARTHKETATGDP